MSAIDAASGAITAAEQRFAGEVRRGFASFRDGDVLFAKITPSMENGKAAVAKGLRGGHGFGSTELFVLRPAMGVLSEFLYYFLRRPSFRDEAAKHMTGRAGQRRVPAPYLRSVPLPLTATGEQRRLVDYLARVDERYGTTRAGLLSAAETVDELRSSALWTGCLGRSDNDAPQPELSHEEAPLRTTLAAVRAARSAEGSVRGGRRHDQYLQPALPDDWEAASLPDLPDGWAWSTVGFAALRLQYGTSARSTASSDTGVPNIGMQNIQRGQLDLESVRYVALDDQEREKFRLDYGDLLFNRTNSPALVGKAAVFDQPFEAVFASYLVRVAIDPRVAEPQFVAYWINSPWGRAWAAAAKRDALSQSNINSKKLASMPMPLAPLEEQRRVCVSLEGLLARADQLERQIEAELAQADAARWRIVDEAFAGKLRIPGSAVSSEPPEALLNATRRALEPANAIPVATTARPRRVAAQTGAERVAEAIASMDHACFTFDDLRDAAQIDYDELTAGVFALLGDHASGLRQTFDAERRQMCFTWEPS